MSKKYLSLEETASALGVSKDELIRLREKGEIRGFADRGTWKFREEDVTAVRRSRQADSDPDVPMFVDEDSAIHVADEVAEQPTIITKGKDPLSTSDSEVKLMGDLADDMPAGMNSETDVRPVSMDSDSDVKMVGDSAVLGFGLNPESALGVGASDSAKLNPLSSLDSDSDVALVADSSGELNIGPLDDHLGSDSDVRLVTDEPKKKGSDSDVKLVKKQTNQRTSDSDVALLSDDDDAIALDFTPGDGESASVLSDESGLSISGDDSAMLLRSGSGISLEGPSDSGIAITADDDEGITLDIGGDSGISLESVADSGISLEDSAEFGGTIPMMKVAAGDDAETAFEIPSLKSDDSEFELNVSGGGSDNATAVFDLAGAENELDDAAFDVDDVEADDSAAEFDAGDDELDVADDVLGEDDELDELDVFDADEDVFDEAGAGGGQQFASPVGAVAVEQEWGGGTFAGLLVSTAMLAVVGIVMFDLIHNIWSYKQPTAASSQLLDALGGIYGAK
jgi:excisionase family DNA binding protein